MVVVVVIIAAVVVILLVAIVVLVIVLVVVIVAVNAPDCFFHVIFYAFRRCTYIRNAVITLKSPAVSSFSNDRTDFLVILSTARSLGVTF